MIDQENDYIMERCVHCGEMYFVDKEDFCPCCGRLTTRYNEDDPRKDR